MAKKRYLKFRPSILPQWRVVLRVFLGVLAIGIVSFLTWKFVIVKPVVAGWFDDSWLYRVKIEITNSGSNQTDFQVSFTLDTATLITASKMQGDCDDIRVTDANGLLLAHWIETNDPGCNNAATQIWIKHPSVTTGGVAIYVYYGNTQAVNVQNGSQVFPFFDDFTTGTLSGQWTATGAYSLASGELTITTGSVYTNNTILSSAQNYIYESRIKWIATTGSNSGLTIADVQATSSTNTNGDALVYYLISGAASNYNIAAWVADGTVGSYNIANGVTQYTATDSTYYINSFSIDSTTVKYYQNRTLTNSYTATWTTAPYLWLGYFLGSASGTAEAKDMTSDWVLARKFAATAPSAGAAGTEEKAPGPVAWWKMDEGADNTCSGGTNDVCDSSGNGSDGAISGATWQTEDKCISGKCLFFDGTNDYVNVGDVNGLEFTADFTISVWAKNSSSAVENVLINYGTTNDWLYALSFSTDDLIHCKIYQSGSGNGYLEAISTRNYRDSQWHNISCAVSGTNVYLYVDGQIVASDTTTSGTRDISTAGTLSIGKFNWTSQFFYKGSIDEVKIYPYARTAAQVKADFVRGAGGSGSAAVLGAQSTEFLNQGLVGYWPMDETWPNQCTGGANDTCDKSGNVSDGAWNGNVATVSGKFANGTVYDGNGDYVSVGDISNLNPTTNFTVSAWIYKTGNSTGTSTSSTIAGKWNTAASEGWFMEIGDSDHATAPNQIRFYTAGVSDLDLYSGSTASDNAWHHIVAKYDGVKKYIYIDGVQAGTEAVTGTPVSSTDAFQIGFDTGSGGSNNYFNGRIDEVRVYQRALSGAEIAALYNWAPGPVRHYKFDEGNGATAYDTAGGTTASIANGTWTQGKYGNALSFNGTSTLVTGDNPVIHDYFTVSAWAKVSDTGIRSIVGTRGPSGSSFDFKFQSGTTIHGDIGNGSGYITTTADATYSYLLDNWYYISYVVTPTGYTIYVNGTQQGSGTYSTEHPVFSDSTHTIAIGSYRAAGGSEYFYGAIDDVRIYSYARTQKQIVADMNADHPSVGSPVGSAFGYWKFDEGYGDSTANSGSAGSALNGNLEGSCPGAATCPAWTNDGKYGKSLSYDGGDYLQVPDDNAFNFPENSFTFTGWFKTANTGVRNAIFAKSVAGQYISVFVYTDDRLWLETRDSGATYISAITPTGTNYHDNVWHHFAAIRSDTLDKLLLYVDGVLMVTTDDTRTGNFDIAATLRIGRDGGANYFNGQLDEIKAYSYVLTPDEVKLDYNQGKSLVLGALSQNSSNVASNSASTTYCVPGDTTTCRSPVLEYLFNENTGTSSVNDTSGNNTTGSMTSMAASAWSPGINGSSLNFDGSDDVVTTGSNLSALPIGQTARTISVWVKPTNTSTGGTPVHYGNGATAGQDFIIELATITGTTYLFTDGVNVNNNITISGMEIPSNDIWSHIAFVFDGSTTWTYYLNGKLIKSGTFATTINTASPTILNIADRTDTALSNFPGGIDNVRIYNYARTAAQIAWEYNKGAPVAWYKFDECEGTSVYNTASASASPVGTIVPGASGNTSAGTCTSGTSTHMWYNGATGKYNSSLDFDGIDDYVNLGIRDDILRLSTGEDITISAWAKLGTGVAATAKRILSTYPGSASPPEFINLGFGTTHLPAFSFRDTSSNLVALAGDKPLNDDQWHLLTGVRNTTNDNAYLYVDGIFVATTQDTTTAPAGSDEATRAYIGANEESGAGTNPENLMDGLIDDVRIYNYALTSTQIRTLYNENKSVRFGPAEGSP